MKAHDEVIPGDIICSPMFFYIVDSVKIENTVAHYRLRPITVDGIVGPLEQKVFTRSDFWNLKQVLAVRKIVGAMLKLKLRLHSEKMGG